MIISEKSQQSALLEEDVTGGLAKEAKFAGGTRSLHAKETLDERLAAEDAGDEERPIVIAVTSYKGGVAKTTTSVNLAVCLANGGYNVLVVDMDAQGNASQYLGVYDFTAQAPCIADVLCNTVGRHHRSLEEVMLPASPFNRGDDSYDRVWVVPSHSQFATADSLIKSDGVGVGTRLGFAVDDMDQHFDYVIVDCAPALDITVANALIALKMGNSASMAVIPVANDAFAITAAQQTVQYTESVAKAMRYSQSFPLRILKTMVDDGTRACKAGMTQLKYRVPEVECFDTVIPSDTVVSESNLAGVPVVTYAPSSEPAVAYRALAKEIEEIVEGR